MFPKHPKEKFVCGIDLGSHWIKMGLIRLNESKQPEIVGVYEHQTFGFAQGSVTNLAELSDSLRGGIQELEKKSSLKIKEIFLGVGGSVVSTRVSSAVIPLIDRGSKVINARDVAKADVQARLLGIKLEEEILHDLPQQYLVDDASVVNPVGLYGRKLGVSMLIILATQTRLRNIIKAVHQAGYDVIKTYFTSLIAGDVLLTKDDKNDGCILMDVGANTTTVLMFKNQIIQYLNIIDVGAKHFSSAIAQALNLTIDLAEEVKLSYGTLLGAEGRREEEILVKREGIYLPIKRQLIFEAMEPVWADYMSKLQLCFQSSSLLEKMNKGIIMMGGGALLSGLMERIAENYHVPVRLAKLNIPMNKYLSNVAVFAPVLGMMSDGIKTKMTSAKVLNAPNDLRQNFLGRVKELYQEYF